jgi:hypothetical protein
MMANGNLQSIITSVIMHCTLYDNGLHQNLSWEVKKERERERLVSAAERLDQEVF